MAIAKNAEGFASGGRASRVADGDREAPVKGGRSTPASPKTAGPGATGPIIAGPTRPPAQPTMPTLPHAATPFVPAASETFPVPGPVKPPPGRPAKPDFTLPDVFRPDFTLPDVFMPPDVVRPPRLPPVFPEAASKTATQLAEAAIEALNAAPKAVLDEAVNTVRNRNIAPNKLMDRLERRVKVGEVLNLLSKDWSDDTKSDFAEAFGTTVDKLAVMDAIVSLAVLNDPDLDDEIRGENTPETTTDDLLDRRVIVWQSHPAGTPLQWPYLLLVAVERVDMAKAEDVIKGIVDRLTTVQGFRLPKTAAGKLG